MPSTLMFHHLDPELDHYTNYEPQDFLTLVAILVAEGFKFVTASQAIRLVTGDRAPDRRLVVLTFDDAYFSVGPVLAEAAAQWGVVGTLFPIVGSIGRPNSWNLTCGYRRTHLPWSGLRELADAGYEIGNHSFSHAVLPDLPAGLLTAEIEGSHTILAETLRQPPTIFAYPFGRHDALVRAAVGRLYSAAFTTQTKPGGRRLAEDALALRRIAVTHDLTPSSVCEVVASYAAESAIA